MRRTSGILLGVAAGGLLLGGAGVAVQAQRGRPEARMAEAAKAFLASLDEPRKAKAIFTFGSDERLNWHFIPKERKGLPLKEMTEPQRETALRLLRSSMSQTGDQKAASIRSLEIILRSVEMGKGPVRDPEQYFFSVFGEPSETGTWGWRYEGHHCAQNWTIVNGKGVASSPQFFGTNPAEVRVEVPGAPPKGTRVLVAEEDVARELVTSLSEEQRKEAVLSPTAPPDIFSGASRKAMAQEDRGIAQPKLSEAQQATLQKLIDVYVNTMPRGLANQRLTKLKQAGIEKVKFAWLGGLQKGEGHYYRVQGPTFLIEYDNTQNNNNHVHAVWRDFKGDFGMDLLAMHHQAYPHKIAREK